jgi:hypothetical protein
VVGDGPLEPAVRETAAELPGRVALLGALPHAEVLALFRRARLAVVPSYSEPFGFVVLEAFTQGTPVVAADTGGIPEIADDASGAVLVPPRDAPALARAIARLAAAPAERAALSHAAYERAHVFAFERAGPETVALYRACADAGRATPPVATGDAPRGGAGAARPEPAREHDARPPRVRRAERAAGRASFGAGDAAAVSSPRRSSRRPWPRGCWCPGRSR